MKTSKKATIIALLALFALFGSAAEANLEAYGGYGSVSGALIGASASGSLERIEELWALRLSASAEASSALASGTSSALLALAEFSVKLGSFLLLASPEGSVYYDDSGLAWASRNELSLTSEGASLSVLTALHFDILTGDEAYREAGLRIAASLLAGDSVLKPEASLSWREELDGSSSLSVLPRLGFSWYPGFPLSIAAGAGFERSWDQSGGSSDSIPATLALYGSFGSRLLWTTGARAKLGLEGLSLEEAAASAELSFLLASRPRSEIRLPLGCEWDLDPESGFSLHAGLGISFD